METAELGLLVIAGHCFAFRLVDAPEDTWLDTAEECLCLVSYQACLEWSSLQHSSVRPEIVCAGLACSRRRVVSANVVYQYYCRCLLLDADYVEAPAVHWTLVLVAHAPSMARKDWCVDLPVVDVLWSDSEQADWTEEMGSKSPCSPEELTAGPAQQFVDDANDPYLAVEGK